MIGKLAFFLIIAALVYWLLKIRSSEASEDTSRNSEDSTGEKAPPSTLEEMVRCARCGVHLPRSESVTSQGEFFCSNEHRLEHQDTDTTEK